MKRNRLIWMSGGLLLCFLFSLIMAVTVGSTPIEGSVIWQVIAKNLFGVSGKAVDPAQEVIIWQIRFPRVLFAAVVGSALSISGVLFQGLLKNPLADPYILGISSGSAVGMVAAVLSGLGVTWASWLGNWGVPLSAFLGGCLSLLLVFVLADRRLESQSLILAGIIVNALFGAILTFAISISGKELPRIQFWLMGSFSLREWVHIWILLPVFIVSLIVAWLFARELNILSLGERTAIHLGIPVRHLRLFLLLLSSLLTAIAVSVSGIIGFVGLVIPHAVRMIIGADHRWLIPMASLAGAIFLVWSDCLARTILEPREVPIGVITAIVGAPFFAYLLKKQPGAQDKC